MNKISIRIINKVKKILGIKSKIISPIEYWRERAKQYGERSVFNISHTEAELLDVTRIQKDKLFPIFREQLNGNEELLLDFGCGSGRFTSDLATIIKGKSIGIDPTEYLINLAKKNVESINTEYRLMNEGMIPVGDASVDVVWICLVLGGIVDDEVIEKSVSEIKRVLKSNGLILLVENTQDQKDGDYWKFRTVEDYKSLFNFTEMELLSDYYDVGEKISIMSGRLYV